MRLAIPGAHQVGNTLLAAAVALAAGLSIGGLAEALGRLRLVSTRRMDVFDRADGVTVIDDSYNANPASTAAALQALAALGAGRRTIAVLGYLAELGEFEREGHEQVGRLAARLGVDRLVVVGEAAAPIHNGATAEATWGGESVLVTDQTAAVEALRQELRPGDVVLVKGSGTAPGTSPTSCAARDGLLHEGRHRRGRGGVPGVAVRHADRDQGVHPAEGGPADPVGRPADAHGQARHPDHGRRRLHRRHDHRVRGRPPRPDDAPERQIFQVGPTITALVLLGLFVFCGAIGFIDDFLKVRKRNSAGLNKRGKLLGTLLVGAAFGMVALYFPSTNGETVGSTRCRSSRRSTGSTSARSAR